jgi:drug/metabolite transporter (DMT)-like permease
MPEIRSAWAGYGSVVLAAFLWALSGNAAKVLFNHGLSPIQLVQLRTTIASVVLFAGLLIFRRHLLKVERRDIPYFIMMGVILAAVHFTYLYTISLIPVAVAILIQYQSPILIALHARIFRKKRLSRFAVFAIMGAIAGCYLMVGAYNLALFSLNKAGILAGLVSAVVFALYAIKSEDGMRTYPAWTILTYALLVAAVIWNVVQPPFGAFRRGYDALSWGLILYIAVFGTAISFGLYNLGIRSIKATHASITATLEPVFAGIIAYALLGEGLEPLQIAGGGLVIFSILLLQIRQGRT